MLCSKSQVGFPFALVLVIVLAACGSAASPRLTTSLGASPTLDATSLDGTEWNLHILAGRNLVTGTHITLNFAEEQANGFAGCNAYGGPYSTTDSGDLSFSEMAITAQGCLEPEGVMEQEVSYMEALWAAASYRIANDRLEILNDAGEPVLAFTQKREVAMNPIDLVGSQWSIVSLNGDSPIEGSTITLAFDDETRASGHAGCRDYVATYEAEGDDLHFLFLSMHGEDACLDREAMALQEGAYTTMLEWVRNYRLGENQLELWTARGEVLVFESLPGDAKAGLAGTIESPTPWPDAASPKSPCDEYLDLWVSFDGVEEQATVSSYECQNVHVDSTGRSPTTPSDLVVPPSALLSFRLKAVAPPQSIEARLYPQPGLVASFFHWPEELPTGANPIARFLPEVSSNFQILPGVPSGEYSLVIRVTWADAQVFYGVNFVSR